MDYQQYIVRDPKVCGGEPVIKGTRVTVRTVLASLVEGAKAEEILEDFPTLKEEDIREGREMVSGTVLPSPEPSRV
jgi:uncharacterized protein (DUF433 family)